MIYTGDCRNILPTLEDESVDCIITSPPYYNLRDYGIDGQIGSEKKTDEYIGVLAEVFHHCRRILKSTGTLWINIADSYSGSGKGKGSSGNLHHPLGRCKESMIPTDWKQNNLSPTNLMGIPWKLAFALQDDGWILRQDIIWAKTNPMPEPAGRRRRFVSSYEHVFLLAKTRAYYWDDNVAKEPAIGFDTNPPRGSAGTIGNPHLGRRNKGNSRTFRGGSYTNNNTFENSANIAQTGKGNVPNISGMRNMRDVWQFATASAETQNLKSDIKHFATFPEELPRRCILAGCPPGGVVLDPFCGSGTTGKVAYDLGREFIGIELNPAYAAMAEKRIGTTKQAQLEVDV